MTTLDETIRTLKERLAAREHTERLLRRAGDQLDAQQSKLKRLRADLKKENADVDRLEGLTLTALFHTVLSSKTEQLKTERQEALRAKLAVDECRAAVASITSAAQRLREELKGYDHPGAALAEALAERENVLLSSGGPAAQRLFELASERAEAHAESVQLREAARAGARAYESLREVIRSLNSAGSWGTWDMMGGGLISTAMKHSHIDKSKEFARDAQDDLRQFASELEDVRETSDFELRLSSFDRFADYFLDGLVFDWVVQSKINRSREATAKVQRQVKRTMMALDVRAQKLKRRIDELKTERRRTIDCQ